MVPSQSNDYKSLLRNKLQQARLNLSDSNRRLKSRTITEKLIRMPVFIKSKNLLTYVALPDEVATRPIVRTALRSGKNVFVPAVDFAGKQIKIYQIHDWKKDLRRSSFGILEPRRIRERLGNPKKLDFVVVPGVGFDRQGGRLGRGGGFFDRFLKKAKSAQKIGIAFREQMLPRIPMNRSDVRMDGVITD